MLPMSKRTHVPRRPFLSWDTEGKSTPPLTLSTSLLLIWLCSSLYLEVIQLNPPHWIFAVSTWCYRAGPACQCVPPLDSPPYFPHCLHLLKPQDCVPWEGCHPLDWKDCQPPLMANPPLVHLTSALTAPPLLSDAPSSSQLSVTPSKSLFPFHLQSSPISTQPSPACLPKNWSPPARGRLRMVVARVVGR